MIIDFCFIIDFLLKEPSFSIEQWLKFYGLEDYHDKFIECGLDKKIHWLQLKNDVGNELEVLKRELVDYKVELKPAHTKTLLTALKELKN